MKTNLRISFRSYCRNKPNASAALAASGALPENVNYAVKSSFLLSFLERPRRGKQAESASHG